MRPAWVFGGAIGRQLAECEVEGNITELPARKPVADKSRDLGFRISEWTNSQGHTQQKRDIGTTLTGVLDPVGLT
jgi:hypothetical protein